MSDQPVPSAPTVAAAKAEWKVKRDALRAERNERRRWQRRCFWTRPIGHAWEYGDVPYHKVCAICDKEVYVR